MASAMRSLVRRLLSQMERDGMVTPASWGEATMVERGYMLQELYKEYPCITWCHNHWKADVLVSRVLSGRKSNAKKRGEDRENRTKNWNPFPNDRQESRRHFNRSQAQVGSASSSHPAQTQTFTW